MARKSSTGIQLSSSPHDWRIHLLARQRYIINKSIFSVSDETHHKECFKIKRIELFFGTNPISAMLSYRSYGCCRQIYKKLFHTLFHILAVPAIVMGFITVLDSHNLAVPSIPNFYSIHSWMGLTTMGLFAIQVFRMVISFWAKRWPDIYLTALKKAFLLQSKSVETTIQILLYRYNNVLFCGLLSTTLSFSVDLVILYGKFYLKMSSTFDFLTWKM